jgi:hypothetical protein
MGRTAVNKTTNIPNVETESINESEASLVTNVTTEADPVSEVIKEVPVDMTAILKMLEDQRKIIEALQKQVSTPAKTETIVTPTPLKGSVAYDANRIVAVVCMYDGESLTLKTGHQGERITLYGYGDKQYFRYEVAANMARMNRSFAIRGYFIFEDSDIIRDFGLEKSYESFIDKSVLDKLDSLDAASVTALYNRSNDAYKTMIIDKFVNGYIEGISNFRHVEKIDALTKVSGKDIQYTIDEVQKANRMKKK